MTKQPPSEELLFLITLEPEYNGGCGRQTNGVRLFTRNEKGESRNVLITDCPCYFYVEDDSDLATQVRIWSSLLRQELIRPGKPLPWNPEAEVPDQMKCLRNGYNHSTQCWKSRFNQTANVDKQWPPKNIPCGCFFTPIDYTLHLDPQVYPKRPYHGYFEHPLRMRKIQVKYAFLLPILRRLLMKRTTPQLYELHLDAKTRFQLDSKLVGGCWFSLPSGKGPFTYQQLGKRVQKEEIPPLRICSLDIECLSADDSFPVPETSPVICIATIVQNQKTLFISRETAPIDDVEVITSRNEREMFKHFRNYVLTHDIDVFTGWNIENFDIPYLFKRAHYIGLDATFMFQGKPASETVTRKASPLPYFHYKHTFSSKQRGNQAREYSLIYGRLCFDAYLEIRQHRKMRSYKLGKVSLALGLGTKDDVSYDQIPHLWETDAHTRATLGKYCVQDALLVQDILNQEKLLVNRIQMARVSGLDLPDVWKKGMSYMVERLILRKCQEVEFLHPTFLERNGTEGLKNPFLNQYVFPDILKRRLEIPPFEGAIVLEPKPGFYTQPIPTFDFNSLYPSIIQAFNLSHDTLTTSTHAKIALEAPNGYYFIRKEIQEGILPQVVRELTEQRSLAKQAMKQAPDEHTRSLFNGRQLALKCCANSVYGWTGSKFSNIPCKPIASSVTAYGRDMIMKTKQWIEEHYPGSEVIYGDTDSVMVKFNTSLQEAHRIAQEIEQVINNVGLYTLPNFLEFEKVFFPYLLLKKKKYPALLYKPMTNTPHFDAKGIEVVRRDNFPFLSNTMKWFLDEWFHTLHPPLPQLIESLQKLRKGLVPLADLIFTTELKKWDHKAPHVSVALKRKKRQPADPPRTGDRIPYVFVKKRHPFEKTPYYGHDKSLTDKAEDPAFVQEQNIAIDYEHYTKAAVKPFLRLMAPLEKVDLQQLLSLGGKRVKKRPVHVSSITNFFRPSNTNFVQPKKRKYEDGVRYG